MTIAELLANEELRRREFPVTANQVFLAHAGDCPLPRRVADAIAKYAGQCTTGDQEKFVYPAVLERGRKLCERLLSFASPLELYAEEIDPHSGRHLGNFPQAFTHLALINAVVHVIRAEESAHRSGPGTPMTWAADADADAESRSGG